MGDLSSLLGWCGSIWTHLWGTPTTTACSLEPTGGFKLEAQSKEMPILLPECRVPRARHLQWWCEYEPSKSPECGKLASTNQYLRTAQLLGAGSIIPSLCEELCWDCSTLVPLVGEGSSLQMDGAVWCSIHCAEAEVDHSTSSCLPTDSRHLCPGHRCQWTGKWSSPLSKPRWSWTGDCIWQSNFDKGWKKLLCHPQRAACLGVLHSTFPLLSTWTSLPGSYRSCSTSVASRFQTARGASGPVARATPRVWIPYRTSARKTTRKCRLPVKNPMPPMWTRTLPHTKRRNGDWIATHTECPSSQFCNYKPPQLGPILVNVGIEKCTNGRHGAEDCHWVARTVPRATKHERNGGCHNGTP